MPTPDDIAGGTTDADLLILEPQGLGGQSPTTPGEVTYSSVDGAFRMQDAIGVFDPRGGGGGITEAQHAALRQLIHFIDDGPGSGFASGAFRETISSGPFPTEVIWWEDGTKTGRIVDLAIVYSGAFPSSETWRMYDTDGSTVLITLVDAISYSGAVESSRTRTWS